MRMSHAKLQGSECDGEVEHACHRLQGSESVCGGVVQHTCLMHVICLTLRK